MIKFSKNELIHMLKKEISHNKELEKQMQNKDNRISEMVGRWNDFQLANNPSSVNAWISIEKFFDTNEEIKQYYDEVSRELTNDGCYSKVIIMTTTIEKLLEKVMEYDDYRSVY